MFRKILIANRGEIACRVMRTAQRMGIGTVAVFSDADRDALHVEMADEAVGIGPAPAAESYLNAERIIQACNDTGAEAVHPGYGFLSERAAFAEALKPENIVFIGPPASAIEAMGDKIESKKRAQAAGVSTVPGFLGVVEDSEHAVRIATEIGFPVMIKASAGGGGKGMRVAWNEAEAREGFERARSEAKSSFGDDRVFIEKFVEEPRHIEIQVLADAHGNCIHLGERECSIQRRNQKVVEEAPSPFLDAATREAMGAQAVALAKAVGYASAGTVEFIVDRNKNFYFLEMNTRLQVEHPVTELVTGLDLVEEMIRVAAGESLRLGQEDVRMNGWAIESRIYAEDPVRGFLPSVGRLRRYRPPQEVQTPEIIVRNDTGVTEGSEISIFYDPMIAKLCAWAPTREAATDAMGEALDRFAIDGVEHNIGFLSVLMRHPRWREGRLSTGFIAEEFPDGFAPHQPDSDQQRVLACVSAAIDAVRRDRLQATSVRREVVTQVGPARLTLSIEPNSQDRAAGFAGRIAVEGREPVEVRSAWRPGDPVWEGEVGGLSVAAQVRPLPAGFDLLSWRGMSVKVRTLPPHIDRLDRLMPEKKPADTSKQLRCPMPGLVVTIAVSEGRVFKAGETLAVVEAMKMENVLRAERDGTVKHIKARPGDVLAVDAVIMEFA
ncbi:MAG TPA: acetyl/propionyl/methylcrotonyl-CoA carboxylase subunit alpha [Mesorhizobium sp.]|jgi:propionyl-CoA carboxylase alpha chain|nr:acetyl/propionyl/methylcrotonyl-CoA carboxylase subunit alpha [Mesorhizobium sp.]